MSQLVELVPAAAAPAARRWLRMAARVPLAVLASCALTLPLTHSASAAPAYPAKPVRLVVPFAAGGTTDIVARTIGPALSAALGQAVVIDNRPGAGSNIGADAVAKAAPDGHTLLLTSTSTASNPSLYAKLSYDPSRDLIPISLVAEIPVVLVVNPGLPARSAAELIALAKRQPGVLNFGSSGNGGLGHLTGELFKTMTRTDIVHVPYKGNGPALTDLMSGTLSMAFSDLAGALPLIRTGKLRALGIADVRRSPLLPDVPTLDESAVPGFHASSWFGLFVTAGTPPEVVDKLGEVVTKTLRAPQTAQKLAELGFQVVGSSPAEFAQFFRKEVEKWGEVVKTSGARVE